MREPYDGVSKEVRDKDGNYVVYPRGRRRRERRGRERKKGRKKERRKENKEERKRKKKRERETVNAGTTLKGSHKTLSYKTAQLLSRSPTKSQKKILLSQNEHENSSQTLSSSHIEEINRISDPEEGEREEKKK